REIYVTTLSKQKGAVCVPLRGNLFVSEIELFSKVFETFQQEVGVQPSVGEYLNAMGAYLVTRLPVVTYLTDSGIPHFVFGSLSWVLTPDQHVNITDISCEDTSACMPLAPDVDVGALPKRLLEMIEERRGAEFFGYELYFPVNPSAEVSE